MTEMSNFPVNGPHPENEDPEAQPGFMVDHRYYTDSQSWGDGVRESNRQYQERDDATKGYEPYEVRPVYVYDSPIALPS